MPPQIEQASILIQSAKEDAAIVYLSVKEASISDRIVGLHMQAAAEKCLKAVLIFKNSTYPFTHDLQLLYNRLVDSGINPPQEVLDTVDWSSFAGAARYGNVLDLDPIDRNEAQRVVSAVLAWCTTQMPTT